MKGAALIILDGWGLAPEGPGNCVRKAETPVVGRLAATRPFTISILWPKIVLAPCSPADR